MSPGDFDFPLTKFLSATAGAAISMLKWPGTVVEKITMGIAGVAISYVMSEWVAEKTGLPAGVTGFLLGLFGMMIVGKLWEMLAALDAKAMAADAWAWVKKRAGV
jgi:hypothetical protein